MHTVKTIKISTITKHVHAHTDTFTTQNFAVIMNLQAVRCFILIPYGEGQQVKGKVVPVLKEAPRHEGVVGSGGIAPRNL
jgi:hypothetical protein